MHYTIREVSEILDIPASTIRYYDKEGLIPAIDRRESGYRMFSENNLQTLRSIECLKKAGMSIREIRTFFQWVQQGDDTLQQRYEMFLQRRRIVEEQIAQLQKTLEYVDYKCWYYETAVKAGTVAVHQPVPARKNPLESD